MRLTVFWERMNEQFGEGYAESVAKDYVMAELGGRTIEQALADGDVLEAMRRDKKVVHGRLHFVIAIEIGATMTVDDVAEDELRAVLLRLGLKG